MHIKACSVDKAYLQSAVSGKLLHKLRTGALQKAAGPIQLQAAEAGTPKGLVGRGVMLCNLLCRVHS